MAFFGSRKTLRHGTGPLTALSPLDGRYHNKADPLRPYFSESALIRYRVHIEIEWLKALSADPAIAEVAPFSPATQRELDEVVGRSQLAMPRR